jgi:LysM repeat protein
MKIPFRPPKKKKLQATTAAARRSREADFTEEPNVKLSSAFIVVLVLHVVAVGGIYAFNAIKAHQPPAFEDAESPQATPATVPTLADNTATPADSVPVAPATPVASARPRTYLVKSGDSIAKIAKSFGVSAPEIISMNNLRALGGIHVGQELQIPAAPDSDQTTAPKTVASRDSGSTYTVLHGDTPVSIARKLHVDYGDLVRLNKIDDPRKLRIGSKLKIPVKRAEA